MGPLPARQIVGERTSGPVTVAMLLIVISFSGSLVISQFRLRNIEDRAATIFQEALPNLEHVSTLRTELRRLGMYVTEYALAGDARLSPSRQDLREVRARVGAELEAYRARPGPPEEATAWVEIAAGLSLLDESVDQTLQAADAKVAPALIQPLLEIFHTRLERADAAILRLRQTQVDLVRSDSERILEARQASLRLALALGGGSLLLALLASGLVLQTLKSRAELKEAHDRLLLRHANRLATVGQLAAGIAHELGSPLQVVAGRAKLLSTGESADEDARSAGRIILGQAQRMTSIVRGLLDYARRRPALRAVTDLTEVADQTLQVLRPIARKRSITLELEAEGPLFAQVDTLHIQQALTNLVMNALQAVNSGGHVRITAGLRPATPPSERGGIEGVFAALGVKDDGPGITQLDKARVFEPFFTTKEVSEGSGLGLAVADGLVHENGGWIGVESEVGQGAFFSIFLPPLAKPKAPA